MNDTTIRLRVNGKGSPHEIVDQWETCVARAEDVHRYYLDHRAELRPKNSSWRVLETLPTLVQSVRDAVKESQRITTQDYLLPPAALILRGRLIHDLKNAFQREPKLLGSVTTLDGQVGASGLCENIHALVDIAERYRGLLTSAGVDMSSLELVNLLSDEFDTLYLCKPKYSGEKRVRRAQRRLNQSINHLNRALEEIERAGVFV